MTELCQRCEDHLAAYLVTSDMIHMRVCRRCAARARKIMESSHGMGRIESVEEIKKESK